MNYNIPALDALTNAEKKLLADMGVLRSKIDIVEVKLDKALGLMCSASNMLGGLCRKADNADEAPEKRVVTTVLQ